jgi:hypothetical protein
MREISIPSPLLNFYNIQIMGMDSQFSPIFFPFPLIIYFPIMSFLSNDMFGSLEGEEIVEDKEGKERKDEGNDYPFHLFDVL